MPTFQTRKVKRLRGSPAAIHLITRGRRAGTGVLVTTVSWGTRSADVGKGAVRWAAQGAVDCGRGHTAALDPQTALSRGVSACVCALLSLFSSKRHRRGLGFGKRHRGLFNSGTRIWKRSRASSPRKPVATHRLVSQTVAFG